MKFSDPDHQVMGFKLLLDYEFGALANNKAIVNGLKTRILERVDAAIQQYDRLHQRN
jgi:hypothetical protein